MLTCNAPQQTKFWNMFSKNTVFWNNFNGFLDAIASPSSPCQWVCQWVSELMLVNNPRYMHLWCCFIGALRIGSPRDFCPSDQPSTYSFWAFKPVCTKAFRPISGIFRHSVERLIMAWQTKAEPGTAGQSQVKPSAARFSAIMCFILEKQAL